MIFYPRVKPQICLSGVQETSICIKIIKQILWKIKLTNDYTFHVILNRQVIVSVPLDMYTKHTQVCSPVCRCVNCFYLLSVVMLITPA